MTIVAFVLFTPESDELPLVKLAVIHSQQEVMLRFGQKLDTTDGYTIGQLGSGGRSL